MKVTVLIAVYDGGPYLRHAIEDVLAQTYRDFELLVVDDASTDGTPELVLGFDDPRVQLIRNERNLGQAPSLNVGLAEARGEYVARLDADDRMLPARLQRQVDVLEREPNVALVGTWVDVVDEDGRLWGKLRGDVRDYADFVAAVLVDHYPFAHPSVMFRRDVVRELGGYDPALAPAEDKDLYRRLVLARREARVVHEPLVHYRRHEAQLSQSRRELQLAVDREGQERFLAELAGRELAETLRRLLTDGRAPAPDPASALDALLAGARERLHLSPAELAAVEHRVVAHVARRAFAAGPAGKAPLAWASARRTALRPVLPLLPLVPPARALGRGLARVSRSAALTQLRSVARRSLLLRRIYAWLS